MGLQPSMIAPFATGLDISTEPWLSPPDSFTIADNVHVFHGYMQKRAGFSLFGTLSTDRVMGILRYIKSDGSKATLGFDTKYAYLYNLATHVFDKLDVASPAVPIFNGGVNDYIWGANWQSSNVVNRLYFTNGLPYDSVYLNNGIRYFTDSDPTISTSFKPSIGGGVTVYGGKLIFSLASRLVVLGVYENNGSTTSYHPQRARWCAKQNPTNWNDVTAGGGDYADAATGDQIISAQSLSNQIIVFFTNSVWSLIPTSDPNKAFRWVRLNSFRACDGKMASVAYDRAAKSLGIRGILASDGTETQRIDQRILSFTTDMVNTEKFGKVFCQRSFETQRWWTLYCEGTSEENNKALIFDDISGAFTTYSVSLNCLGYGVSDRDYGLNDFTAANDLDFNLQEVGDKTLQDFCWNVNEDVLLGGDINGNIYLMEDASTDNGTEIDSVMVTAQWNPYQAEGREALLSFVDFYVDTDKSTTMTVEFYKNNDTVPYATQDVTFLPNLNFIASVNQIDKANPCLVQAASHGLTTGNKIYIYGVEGMTLINSGNGYTITAVDENSFTLDGIDATDAAYGVYTGGGSVYWNEFYQTKAWVRAYGGGVGYVHNLRITLHGGDKPFKIHGIKPSFKARGKRTVN